MKVKYWTPIRTFAPLLALLALLVALIAARPCRAADAPPPEAVTGHAHFDETTATLVADATTPAPTPSAIETVSFPKDDAVPASFDQAAGEIPQIVSAAEGGKWLLLAGMLLGLLIFVGERVFWKDVPSKYLQWAMLAITGFGAIADGLIHGQPLVAALLAGLMAAGSAITTYHVFDEHAPAPSPAGATP